MGAFGSKTAKSTPTKSIFEFEVPAATSGVISLSKFRGKNAYLVVNVASQ